MIDLELPADGLDRRRLAERLRRLLGSVDPDAVVRLAVTGEPEPRAAELLRAASLRELAPASMTVVLRRPRIATRKAVPTGRKAPYP